MSEATKSYTLGIGERLAALKILNEFKGSLDTLSVLLEDVKQFPISEEEWVEAKKEVSKNDDNTERWVWKDEIVQKEITLKEPTLAYLRAEVKKKSDAGEITLADVALVSLNKKIL